MIFNEIKCHVNTLFDLVGGCIPYIPLCPRLYVSKIQFPPSTVHFQFWTGDAFPSAPHNTLCKEWTNCLKWKLAKCFFAPSQNHQNKHIFRISGIECVSLSNSWFYKWSCLVWAPHCFKIWECLCSGPSNYLNVHKNIRLRFIRRITFAALGLIIIFLCLVEITSVSVFSRL